MTKTFWGVLLLLSVVGTVSCGRPAATEVTPAAAAEIAEVDQPADRPPATEPPSPPPPTAAPTALPTPTATPEPLPTPTPSNLPPSTYLETFDGEPLAPEPWHPNGWDVVVHSRDIETWYELEPVEAQHGPNCEGPDVTHTVTRYEDAVFSCRNHMMTTLYASGYGVIYFAPNQLIDLSEKATFSIDVSTFRASNRDWWDIWITPYEDYVQAPLEDFFPDLMGYPRRTIHIRMPDSPNTFFAEQVDEFEVVSGEWEDNWIDYDEVFTPDKMRRDTFVFEFDGGRIRFGMPDYDIWWVDKELAVPLDWDKAIVQIGHHSYNPDKSCDYDGTCGANTWHWDNLMISPAVPFTIITPNERFADNDNRQMSFREAAPAAAELRFMGIGADLEVSFDSGQSWTAATAVEVGLPDEEIADEHFRSYRVAIPEGINVVQFRGQDKWGGVIPWHVRNATIMSLEVGE